MPRGKEKEKGLAVSENVLPLNKLPPVDIEAEQSVLGALLLDRNAIVKVIDVIAAEEFYRINHQKIFEAVRELFDKSEGIDVLTIASRLKEKNLLDEVGGIGYLTILVNSVPTSSHIKHYARIVHEKYVLRTLIQASYEIQSLVYEEGSKDFEQILSEAEENIFRISQKATTPAFKTVSSELVPAFERFEALHRKGKIRGLSTGFKALNKKLSGLQKSDLIVLAARPSLGKTALALDIARNVALQEKIPVAIFSLEMSIEQIVDRLVAAEAIIDLWKFRTGGEGQKVIAEDFELMSSALEKLAAGGAIYVDDAPASTVLEIRTRARKLYADTDGKLGLIIVDYLQLISSHLKTDNRVQQITDITRTLKALAKELDIPVIAISQLSRAVEMRGEHAKPKLSDLRESGSIEQDADVVLFIHRKMREEEAVVRENTAEILIAKHRNGPVGSTRLNFIPQYASFRDLAPEDLVDQETTAEDYL